MNYYKHHIGDFNNATRHVSRLERGIYRDLIDLYYETEMPLQCERNAVARRILVRGEEEMSAMCAVLDEFFILEADGYHHTRCDEELAKVYEKSALARVSAEKRWKKHNLKNSKKANAMRTHSDGNATQDPLPNTKDIKQTPPADPIPEQINPVAWAEWLEHRRQAKKKMTPATIAKQHKFLAQYDYLTQQAIIDTSIEKGWSGLFEPKDKNSPTTTTRRTSLRDDLTDTSWAN